MIPVKWITKSTRWSLLEGDRKSQRWMLSAAFTLAQGNVEKERKFSENEKSITKKRSCFSEASANALQIASDGMEICQSIPNNVPMTSMFIKLVKLACENCNMRLEQGKEKTEIQNWKTVQAFKEQEEIRSTKQI